MVLSNSVPKRDLVLAGLFPAEGEVVVEADDGVFLVGDPARRPR